MVINLFELQLQMVNPSTAKTNIKVVQNDVDTNVLQVRLFSGTTEINYSEINSATITFEKDDSNVVQGDVAVTPTHLHYMLGTNEIAVTGIVIASFQLYGLNGERLTTARFEFEVIRDLITPFSVESTTEYPILQVLINQVEGLILGSGTHVYLQANEPDETSQDSILWLQSF